MIEAESKYEGENWLYTCTVPANTEADVILPAACADCVTINGKAAAELTAEDGIAFIEANGGHVKFTAAAGRYVFEVKG